MKHKHILRVCATLWLCF